MSFNLYTTESLRPWDILIGSIGLKAYTDVYRIITHTSLKSALNRSKTNSIRGLFKDGWVFIWDAYYATHQDFQMQFGPGSINFMLDQYELTFHTKKQRIAAHNQPVVKAVLGEYLK